MVHVKLIHKKQDLKTVALIDSGATSNFLPREIAEILDLDLTKPPKNAVGAELKVDNVTKDSTNIGITHHGQHTNPGGSPAGEAGGSGTIGDGILAGLGNSLVGNATKNVSIENVLDDGTAIATLTGWIEAT